MLIEAVFIWAGGREMVDSVKGRKIDQLFQDKKQESCNCDGECFIVFQLQ